MEEKHILEQINIAALKLLATHPLGKLCQVVVKEALHLTQAEYGILYLTNGEKLEEMYASEEKVTAKVNKNKFFKKVLVQRKIIILDQDQIGKLQPRLTSMDIESAVVAPLTHRNTIIGIVIQFSRRPDHFKNLDSHLLRLYLSMASLAIVKTQLLEEAERALEIRDRFISLASHELRTPLTSLNGYIQLLYKKMANKKTIESRWMEELYHENVRFTNLVKDLLDINRIKQGQLAFVLDEVNMKSVIEKVLEHFHFTQPERSIRLQEHAANKNYVVIGDFQKLVDMLAALIENAVKFSADDSRIGITLSRLDKSIVILLQDEGKGIPQEDLTRIFEGFYKTKYSQNKEGMGVGLLLARHVVSLHRGKMEIISKEGKGTVVKISLPAAKL